MNFYRRIFLDTRRRRASLLLLDIRFAPSWRPRRGPRHQETDGRWPSTILAVEFTRVSDDAVSVTQGSWWVQPARGTRRQVCRTSIASSIESPVSPRASRSKRGTCGTWKNREGKRFSMKQGSKWKCSDVSDILNRTNLPFLSRHVDADRVKGRFHVWFYHRCEITKNKS